MSTAADMAAVLARQRAAVQAALPVPAGLRIDRLRRAVALLVDHGERFVEAMDADFRSRSRDMSRLTDIMASVKPLKHAAANVRRWMRPERRRAEFPLGLFGARARVEYQPKGVVGVISPWNFPVNLTFAPLAGIFAAGNAAMIKPSEFTPATSAVMAELLAASFDETEVAVFTGGADVGEAFSRLPFDHLLFTGATSVAREVMRAASEHLVPLTLELGGKSPVIVGRSADLDSAAERIVIGKLLNAGQVCLAPDYVLVPRELRGALIARLTGVAAQLYPRLIDNPDHTSVISERHARRLHGYLEEARAAGTAMVEVESTDGRAAVDDPRRMPLTLLLDPDPSLAVMQDEIFGPLLPVLAYDTLEEALAFVNARPRPLALYWFGRDTAEERRVLDATVSGGVTINDVIWHVGQEDLPFGGIGASGMGAYHGFDGFREFSHARGILRQSRFNLAKLAGLRPPYGARLRATLRREIRK